MGTVPKLYSGTKGLRKAAIQLIALKLARKPWDSQTMARKTTLSFAASYFSVISITWKGHTAGRQIKQGLTGRGGESAGPESGNLFEICVWWTAKAYAYLCIHMCLSVCPSVRPSVCLSARLSVWRMHVCMYSLYACIFCMHVCMYVCMYVCIDGWM